MVINSVTINEVFIEVQCSFMDGNNKLMLNDDRTEFLVIGTSKQLSEVSVTSITVGDLNVIPVYLAKKNWAPGSTRTWVWQRI